MNLMAHFQVNVYKRQGEEKERLIVLNFTFLFLFFKCFPSLFESSTHFNVEFTSLYFAPSFVVDEHGENRWYLSVCVLTSNNIDYDTEFGVWKRPWSSIEVALLKKKKGKKLSFSTLINETYDHCPAHTKKIRFLYINYTYRE